MQRWFANRFCLFPCYLSGVADNEAEDDEDCLRLIRRYLSYFPTNVYELPPRIVTDDDPERR